MPFSTSVVKRFFILLSIALFQFVQRVAAQQAAVDSTESSTKENVPQKDIADVIKAVFHSKPTPPKSDSSILKPVITVVPAIGYTLQTKLAAVVSGNCVFRTVPQARLSTISASASYTQNRQFILPIQSNIWTKDNKYNLVGETRFLKYPQSTYGLGSGSDTSAEDPMDYQYFRFLELVMRQLTGNLYVGGGYILDYHWGITHQHKIDFDPEGYQAYGPATKTVSSGLALAALYDTRDNIIRPTNGTYASVRYRINWQELGSTNNWQSVVIDARKYYHLPAQSKNILALWSYDWLVLSGKPPYLDLPSTAWDAFGNTGRGYIQGRFRGNQMLYGESEYRFGLSRNGLFGGVAFFNVESFSAGPGTTLQKVQPGYGLGLRIKINKVSNTNLSIDYGFGSQGSKGLYINIGEMF